MEKTPFSQLIASTYDLLRKGPFEDERTITMKSLDRWFTNINYYETRYRVEMSDCLKPDATDAAIAASVEALRIVTSNVTMRIGYYSCEALRDEFSRHWALPRCYNLRSKRDEETYSKYLGNIRDVATSVDAFRSAFRPYVREEAFDRLVDSIHDEIAFYERLRERLSENTPTAFRMLLPIWILKDASPLYSLSIWSDKDRVEEVCKAVCKGFMDHKSEFSTARSIEPRDCEEFIYKVTKLSTELGSCDYVDEDTYSAMSVPELYEALYGDRVDPFYLHIPEDFPTYPVIEAKLFWNLIGGSIFGPMQTTGSLAISTALAATGDLVVGTADPELVEGRGKAIFRQLSIWDEGDPASTRYAFEVDLGSDDFETETPREGLAAVIGRSYSPGYTPVLNFSEEERNESGNLERIAAEIGMAEPPVFFDTDFPKDSAWHMGVFLAGEPRRIYLVDLGSLNGSYVIREGGDGRLHAFAFRGRDGERSYDDVAKPMLRLGIERDAIEVVGCLEARRHDILMLGASQFEIL